MRLVDAELMKYNITHDFDDEGNATLSSDEELTQKCLSINDVVGWLKLAPTVEAEPVRHGHWVKISEYKGDDISGYTDNNWVCSECGEEAIVNEWYMYELTDYCPYCGAKMGGEE